MKNEATSHRYLTQRDAVVPPLRAASNTAGGEHGAGTLGAG